MRRLGPDGFLTPLFKLDAPQHTPRQAMPVTYRINGAIYWIRTSVLLEGRAFIPPNCAPYVMPTERSVDIDSELDLKIADFLAKETDIERA